MKLHHGRWQSLRKICFVLGVVFLDKRLGHVLRTATSALFVQINIFHTGSIGLLLHVPVPVHRSSRESTGS